MDSSKHLVDLESCLGLRFKDAALLRLALTHRSFVHEQPERGTQTNERLEFLGDAVLGVVVTDQLYLRFPELPEGELTRMRASIICTESLARIAQALDLGDYLYLGRGEELTGGRRRERNLARTFEAILGAVYLDQGVVAAHGWALRILGSSLADAASGRLKDDKSRLQESVQAGGKRAPTYRLVASGGPDHGKEFAIEVVVDGEVLASGRGMSKRAAEEDAARGALEKLGL